MSRLWYSTGMAAADVAKLNSLQVKLGLCKVRQGVAEYKYGPCCCIPNARLLLPQHPPWWIESGKWERQPRCSINSNTGNTTAGEHLLRKHFTACKQARYLASKPGVLVSHAGSATLCLFVALCLGKLLVTLSRHSDAMLLPQHRALKAIGKKVAGGLHIAIVGWHCLLVWCCASQS